MFFLSGHLALRNSKIDSDSAVAISADVTISAQSNKNDNTDIKAIGYGSNVNITNSNTSKVVKNETNDNISNRKKNIQSKLESVESNDTWRTVESGEFSDNSERLHHRHHKNYNNRNLSDRNHSHEHNARRLSRRDNSDDTDRRHSHRDSNESAEVHMYNKDDSRTSTKSHQKHNHRHNYEDIDDSIGLHHRHKDYIDTSLDHDSGNGNGLPSGDSIHTYYTTIEDESDRDESTQDKHGKTLNHTPSFTLLSALENVNIEDYEDDDDNNDNRAKIGYDNQNTENVKSSISTSKKMSPYKERVGPYGRNPEPNPKSIEHPSQEDDDYADFIVLDNNDLNNNYNNSNRNNGDYNNGDDNDSGCNNDDYNNSNNNNGNHDDGSYDSYNNSHNGSQYNSDNDKNNDNNNEIGLRRRTNVPTNSVGREENKDIRNPKIICANDRSSSNLALVNSIHSASSSTKNNKKYADTWMSKINGSDNGRPLMFRVGSTCMTMNNLVNENREIKFEKTNRK
jgi:hypothetical protein